MKFNMEILYADESGSTGSDYNNEQQPIFVLGGLLVNDSYWHEINKIINEEKIKISPLLGTYEIHTNEIFNPSKKSYFYTENWHSNYIMLEKIAEMISKLDLKFFHVALDKKDFEKVFQLVKVDPYLIAYMIMHQRISDYISDQTNEKGLIFLDEFISLNEEIPDFSSRFSKMRNDNIVEKALFLKSHDSNFIQLADFYAFYMNKYYCIKLKNKQYSNFKEEHCLKIAGILLEKTVKSQSGFFTIPK